MKATRAAQDFCLRVENVQYALKTSAEEDNWLTREIYIMKEQLLVEHNIKDELKIDLDVLSSSQYESVDRTSSM